MGWTVVNTTRAVRVSGQAAVEALQAAGCQVRHSPKNGPFPEDEVIEVLQEADAVIASMEPYNARVFAACPRLKQVSRCGVGTDAIDMAAATAAGVLVTNTPSAMTEAVADFAFGLMLGIARHIAKGDALMRDGRWDQLQGVELYRKTLGLVGLGRIGTAVARRAAGFSMRVLAYDPPVAEAVRAGRSLPGTPEITFTDLDTLLAQSDFVSLHMPATSENRGVFNAERFAQMKPTAYFINTARGSLVNEADMLEALTAGRIAGAGLDVFAKEPLPPDHPLRNAPNTVLAPHNGSNAQESVREMNRLSAQNILDLYHRQRPVSVCNPEVWEASNLRVRDHWEGGN